MTEAVDDEIIPVNPTSNTGKLIKKKDITEDINPFTWEEKALFEKTVKEYYSNHFPFFLTALRTGMRLGELIALKPGDLDFNGRFIEVRRNFTKGHIGRPKGNKVRRVDMSSQLAEVFKAHITESKKET